MLTMAVAKLRSGDRSAAHEEAHLVINFAPDPRREVLP